MTTIEIPNYTPSLVRKEEKELMKVLGLYISEDDNKDIIKIDDARFDWEYTAEPFELFIKPKNGRRYLKIKMMHPNSIRDLSFTSGII